MSHDIKGDAPTSITIRFGSPLAAMNWYESRVAEEILPADSALFVMDSLDGRSVPGPNKLIVLRDNQEHQDKVTRAPSGKITSKGSER